MDLQHCYLLDSIHLYWEAAYATAYRILLSGDAIDYEEVYSTTTCKGGNETILMNAAHARYVKILCMKRKTDYGSSLWEIEVYGSGRCDNPETAIEQNQSPITVYKFIKDGQIYISRNGIIYCVDGRVCLHTQE